MAKPGNSFAEPAETSAGLTCAMANDHSPDKQQPQTLPTFHSSAEL